MSFCPPAPSFMLGGAVNTNVPAGATRYVSLTGGVIGAPVGPVSWRVPFDCVISELRCNSNIAPGAGETFTYTVMDEGVATVLTCQTVNPDIESQDLVNEANLDEDDLVCIGIVTSAAAGAGRHTFSVKVVPRGP